MARGKAKRTVIAPNGEETEIATNYVAGHTPRRLQEEAVMDVVDPKGKMHTLPVRNAYDMINHGGWKPYTKATEEEIITKNAKAPRQNIETRDTADEAREKRMAGSKPAPTVKSEQPQVTIEDKYRAEINKPLNPQKVALNDDSALDKIFPPNARAERAVEAKTPEEIAAERAENEKLDAELEKGFLESDE